MTFQEKYSQYYNFLYHDKDYKGEVDYILSLIRKYKPNSKSILDLGCGTGNHALLLAEHGYKVNGVDSSPQMLKIANERLQSLASNYGDKIKFIEGDVRSIQLEEQYDIVISLFHVMSYQTSDNDLSDAFATAKAHLKPGGIFLFDCWYGPGVLSELPTIRIKRLTGGDLILLRIAEPNIFPNENLVQVNYDFIIENKRNNTIENFQETHHMRYWFQPEIKSLLKASTLEVVGFYESKTLSTPTLNTWSVHFITKS